MPDGHYGPADPLHWPQALSNDTLFPWVAAISRKPLNPHDPYICFWRVLTPGDFIPVACPTALNLGTVKEEVLDTLRPHIVALTEFVKEFTEEHDINRELDWLASNMRHAFDRLDFPASYRDLVRQHACVQRFFLYTSAWLDFHVGLFKIFKMTRRSKYAPPKTSQMMGCITTTPSFAQKLCEAGVPVWFSRDLDHVTGDEIVEKRVALSTPVNHLTIPDPAVLARHERELTGLNTFITLAGDRHIWWIILISSHYADIAPRMTPTPPASIYAEGRLVAQTENHFLPSRAMLPATRSQTNRYAPCK